MYETVSEVALELAGAKYNVFTLAGTEALSIPFCFDVTVISRGRPMFAERVLGEMASLCIGERRINGIIAATKEEVIKEDSTTKVTLTLRPKLVLAQNVIRPRIILGKSVIEIACEILNNHGYDKSQIKLHLSSQYKSKPYRMQVFSETDFDFLQRILAKEGVYYWFAANGFDEEIHLSDSNDFSPYLTDKARFFNLNTDARKNEAIFFKLQINYQPSVNVEIIDHNEMQPEAEIISRQESEAVEGMHTIYGLGVSNQDEAGRLAKIYKQSLDAKNKKVIGSSTIAALYSGASLTLDADRFLNTVSGDYIIEKIEHSFSQAIDDLILPAHNEYFGYQNRVVLHPKECEYRSGIILHSKFPSLFQAQIESRGDYAELDENGRYFLRHRFDISEAKHAEASIPVARLAPFGGPLNNSENPEVGWHMPLNNGAEVLVSAINGDPNRPIIIGSVPNSEQRSPVTCKNSTQNILRTKNGNELLMDDEKNKEKIVLSTINHHNRLELDATKNSSQINIVSENGAIEIKAKQAIEIEAEDSINEIVGENKTIIANKDIQLTTHEGDINHQADNDQIYIAKNRILLNADENLVIKSGNDLIINTDDNADFTVAGDHAAFAAENGNVVIQSARDINITGSENIEFSQGSAGFRIRQDGAVEIYGDEVNFNAEDCIELNGKINFLNKTANVANFAKISSPEEINEIADLVASENTIKIVDGKLTINLNYDLQKQQPATIKYLDGKRYQITNKDRVYCGIIRQSRIVVKNIDLALKENEAIVVELIDQDSNLKLYIIGINGKKRDIEKKLKLQKKDINNGEVNLTVLPAPFVCSVRHDKQTRAKNKLSEVELQYFREIKNATIFIHGFNVGFDEQNAAYGKEIKGVEISYLGMGAVDEKSGKIAVATITDLNESVYRSRKMLQKQFPQLKPWPENVDENLNGEDDGGRLNGAEAYSWFVNMENNLNQANGFDHNDYNKYSRIINIAWQGNPKYPWDYIRAVAEIKTAGEQLVLILQQLTAENIEINIIAHSLGNGVLLHALNLMPKDSIERIFMWDAAVPNNVLIDKNKTNGEIWHVPNAVQAAKKITVLHSKNDNVLGKIPEQQTNQVVINRAKPLEELIPALFLSYIGLESMYELAMWVNRPIAELFNIEIQENIYKYWRDKDATLLSTLDEEIARDYNVQALCFNLQERLVEVQNKINRDLLAANHPFIAAGLAIGEFTIEESAFSIACLVMLIEQMAPKVKRLFGLLNIMLDAADYQPTPAMGYNGVDTETRRKLGAKITQVVQDSWLFGHSLMKQPSDAMMHNVYMEYIMNKNKGIKNFGVNQ